MEYARDLAIDDGSGEGDGISRLDTFGVGMCLDVLRHAVYQPPQQLTPVVLVRHVLDRHRRVHLPQPGVLQRERERLAAAVALIHEHRPFGARFGIRARQQHGGAVVEDPGDLKGGVHHRATHG